SMDHGELGAGLGNSRMVEIDKFDVIVLAMVLYFVA
ncbi:MAG: hypothetical protein JWR72_826, partial [Flavisolibacter sp.]|nr:hypothetical protein [Flavisolibacter sp.]